LDGRGSLAAGLRAMPFSLCNGLNRERSMLRLLPFVSLRKIAG
jgi:hypothetical protein